MQIALCHENVLPSRGGAEMYVADLARCLVVAGHEVHLYAARWDAAALPQAIHFHALPVSTGPRFLRPWRFSAALRQALKSDRPEVSVGFDKVLGTDVYYPLGGLHVACAEFNLFKHRAGLLRLLARTIQKLDPAQQSFARFERRQMLGRDRPMLVVNSDFVRRHARKYYGLDPAQIRVLHNAIDPARFVETDRPRLRDEARREWGLRDDAVVAAIVAMNYRLKGLEPLLRALPHSPATLTLLVAGNRNTKIYERLAEQLKVRDRVRLIGHCGDVRRVYFASDLLVHPTFYDPCSLVVLEALACGLPVITTAHNGAAELMHPPSEGFVIDDPHDSNQLAGRLSDLTDASARSICGKAARQAAAGWTFAHHVRAFEAILSDATRQRRRAAG
ncbi:MAG: glycosyltransferase family 4 protein [Gemmataceae bacterium]